MNIHLQNFFRAASLFSFSLLSHSLFAAQSVDLYYHPTISSTAELNLVSSPAPGVNQDKLLRKTFSKNGTTHLHMQQMYNGYPVWGAQYIIHVPRSAKESKLLMNGIVYKNLDADLITPTTMLTAAQMQRAIATTIKVNQLKTAFTKDPEAKVIIYFDKNKTAHYAYYIRFTYFKKNPTYIIDAMTFQPYVQWDNYKTLDDVAAGGLGGNNRVGVIYYDGLPKHAPALTMQRDATLNICYLRNDIAVLKDLQTHLDDVQFSCETTNAQHNNIYWDDQQDSAGGGNSPSNDTLYAATVTTKMFADWFNMPLWTDQYGKPAKMVFFMHDSDANAGFTDSGYIVVGDAKTTHQYYPFTSLDVLAHEMGHAVTMQNSNLAYWNESGGLNESFSDMTGKLAQYYVDGTVKNWIIGGDITVTSNPSLRRYMDQPSKDCPKGHQPGDNCSVDTISEIPSDGGLDVHYLSGIYNHVFYLMATTTNWDIKKAYEVMLAANQHYWTNMSDFCQASRGVWMATKDAGYDDSAVLAAFAQVGIDPQTCNENA